MLMFGYSIFLVALLNPVTFTVNIFTFYIQQGAGPVLPETAHNLVATSPVHRTARDKTG